ncbi:hypothetical protein R1flu_021256 [Riccia fluitans]|uniref:Uncharacterized protein n=1 Tax=Riccia fluitans TaxID=41844 RepID=A0ABD1ZNV5_9MARC
MPFGEARTLMDVVDEEETRCADEQSTNQVRGQGGIQGGAVVRHIYRIQWKTRFDPNTVGMVSADLTTATMQGGKHRGRPSG